MTQPYELSKREEEATVLLLQGKSNKQIALSMGISERTVEFHLNHVYAKLKVNSRAEAILQLGKTTGGTLSGIPEKSTVGEDIEKGYVGSKLKWTYEREARASDDHTVGQTIPRSNASVLEVHGQFGAVPAWPAQSGYVRYNNIKTPKADQLYLKLRYSKYSPALAPILIFIDNEPSPRAIFIPVDQGNWNRFVWSEAIPLGKVESGIHFITFYTDGQEYGVADLDKFILTTSPPEVFA